MKKYILLSLILFTSAVPVYAQGQGPKIDTPPVPSREQIEQEVKNQGDDVQIQIQQIQEQAEEAADEVDLPEEAQDIADQLFSEDALTRAGAVSKQVQQILSNQGAEGGIGEQVWVQEQVQQNIQKMEKRSRALRFLIGPDFQAIDSLKQQSRELKEQAQELQQADSGESDLLAQVLLEQSYALEEAIEEKENTFSLFGWAVKGWFRTAGKFLMW